MSASYSCSQSVAADWSWCSSGSCKCSTGFIDNRNGCEEMTDEQDERLG